MLTLRNRLVLVNTLVFLLTFIVLIGVLSGQLLKHVYEQLDQELARVGTLTLDHVVIVEGRPQLADRGNSLFTDLGHHGFVRLLDTKGTVVDGSGDFRDFPVTPKPLSVPDTGIAVTQRDPNGRLLRVYTRPIYAGIASFGRVNIGYVQTASVPEEVQEIVNQIWDSLLVATPLALMIASLVGLLAARKALEPLTTMTHSAAAISADSLAEHRLPIPKTKDEVQALALAFNATLERLSTAFVRQRRFTADASHELRTPVTAILGQAELALSRQRAPEAYREALVRIQAEAERMQRLIGRMLTLARAESGQQVLDFVPTDVAALLRTLTESLTPNIQGNNICLRLSAPLSAVIATDADCLTQIMLNLLENAIAHTEQGEIEVTMTPHANAVRFQVIDAGPGIDPESLALVFQPFFRADPSRQRRSGNVGLGLALAYELTQLLGGHIEATNRAEGGAVFTLTLPTVSSQKK